MSHKKHCKNPELINAYTVILTLALLLHVLFTAVFFSSHIPSMAWYNIGITCFYAFLLVLIHLEFYRLTVTLTHIEVCVFVIVSTLCLGWDYWYCAFLISLAGLSYFNPYQHKKLIHTFPVIEMLVFFTLRVVTLHVPPFIPSDHALVPIFFVINCAGCFTIVMTGAIVSENTLDAIKKIRDRMAYDKLTGIYSKEYFAQKVENRMSESPQTEYCLILTNILGFKYFNELFGNDKGDEILIAQADFLRLFFHDSIYGRVSGDEFAIFMQKSKFTENQILDLFSRLQMRFANHLYLLHIRAGVYYIVNPSEPVEAMLDKARMTIDSVRGQYNTCVTYYEQRILDKSLRENKLLGEFERALSQDEFCFYLQPQITQQGVCIGAEALVRWNHPEQGLIPPMEFIPTLEETGLIWKLDQFIWEQAVRKLREWKNRGKEGMCISVNISPRDFYYLDVYAVLTTLVEQYEVNPGRLNLEITETALMMEPAKQIALIDRLKKYGFEVEIDDFGSGYSSLNTLKDIRADVLKIDMAFLREAKDNARSWSILVSIMELARSIGMKTITEGVETKDQLDNLIQIGCNMFQGYYFSRPIPVEDFEKSYLEDEK